MTTKKKLFVALAAIAASVIIAVVSVVATVAYLTSSAAVSNVFTIGNVSMTMDESKVDINGVAVENGGRVDTNTYKLVPDKKYTKDPIIHVATGSEDCYLFVLVRNDIEAIEVKHETPVDGELTIAQQLAKNGWVEYADAHASTGKVYVYYGVDASGNLNAKPTPTEAGKDYKLFDYFMIDKSADVSLYGAAKVTMTAVAIQTAGFGETDGSNPIKEAWEAVVATYPYIKTGGTPSQNG